MSEKKKREFEVVLPFAGYVYVRVEADDKDSAIEAAMDTANFRFVSGNSDTEIGEFECLEHIAQGNVCYAPEHHARADDITQE